MGFRKQIQSGTQEVQHPEGRRVYIISLSVCFCLLSLTTSSLLLRDVIIYRKWTFQVWRRAFRVLTDTVCGLRTWRSGAGCVQIGLWTGRIVTSWTNVKLQHEQMFSFDSTASYVSGFYCERNQSRNKTSHYERSDFWCVWLDCCGLFLHWLYLTSIWSLSAGEALRSIDHVSVCSVNIHRAGVLIWRFSVEASTLLLSCSGVHLKLPVEFWCKQTAEFTLSFTPTRLRPPAWSSSSLCFLPHKTNLNTHTHVFMFSVSHFLRIYLCIKVRKYEHAGTADG